MSIESKIDELKESIQSLQTAVTALSNQLSGATVTTGEHPAQATAAREPQEAPAAPTPQPAPQPVSPQSVTPEPAAPKPTPQQPVTPQATAQPIQPTPQQPVTPQADQQQVFDSVRAKLAQLDRDTAMQYLNAFGAQKLSDLSTDQLQTIHGWLGAA